MSDNKNVTHPYVKTGSTLNYAKELKNKGLWPPRLHNKEERSKNDKTPTATPFLIVQATVSDNGSRPVPNSQAFYSKSVWLEDHLGIPVLTPVAGGEYTIKCRILNVGAFASYGGIIHFFVGRPGDFNAAAGTSMSLPVFGIGGFSVLPGQEAVASCNKIWKPLTPADLKMSMLVHAFDPFADNIIKRFDARNDRHVGRHDLTADFFVRDWTVSSLLHDRGEEPSTEEVFYATSDVWNRRSNNAGIFTSDQPENENPQAGNGAAGDNFAFVRVSRNTTNTEETVNARFLIAEFGTGSPYINCSAGPDPSIVFHIGEDQKIVSLPWHLHPSSSTHLCMAVQIYSDGDSFMPPGLLGYTPGWPITNLMITNDNNKAQRNMQVWDGIPDVPSAYFALITNGATFARDFELRIHAASDTVESLKNARIKMPGSLQVEALKTDSRIILKSMQPGEKRWVSLEYDSLSANPGKQLKLFFDEIADGKAVNGFSIGIKTVSINEAILSCLKTQQSIMYRMSEGMKIKGAAEGLAYTQQLIALNPGPKQYLQAIAQNAKYLSASVSEMSKAFDGLKDIFGVFENLKIFSGLNTQSDIAKSVGLHLRLLNQLDALQTKAIKSLGDEADILYTVRLQAEVYNSGKLGSSHRFQKIIDQSNEFVRAYQTGKATNASYPGLLKGLFELLKQSAALIGGNIVAESLSNLSKSFETNKPAAIQKMHLIFLNDLLAINPVS